MLTLLATIDYILKNNQKNKCICIHEIIRLIIIKMKMKMKNRSHRYGINRPSSRHGHKCSKYKKYFIIVMLTYIKQHLCNIWSSIHEKFMQHWGWVEKNVAYIKNCLTLSWRRPLSLKTPEWRQSIPPENRKPLVFWCFQEA